MAELRVRVRCLIPGCKRHVTTWLIETDLGALPASEGICAVHWRTVPLRYRQAYRRRTRRLATATAPQLAAWHRLWARCQHIAIERSVGL